MRDITKIVLKVLSNSSNEPPHKLKLWFCWLQLRVFCLPSM